MSQGFVSSRFDNLVSSIDGMRESINTLKAENMKQRERVTMLESQITTMENEMESMKQYLRRDFLEMHGVPVTREIQTAS